jgi:hypothetical protein
MTSGRHSTPTAPPRSCSWSSRRTGPGSGTSFSKTTITIQHEDVRLYLVEVDELNSILASRRAEAEAARWAFIFLEDDWLEQRRVHPLPTAETDDRP